MRDQTAHRYFDTAHAIVQTTVDDDLPTLLVAVRRLVDRLSGNATPPGEPS
jgi:uncharacterized protein with HEPN domain